MAMNVGIKYSQRTVLVNDFFYSVLFVEVGITLAPYLIPEKTS